MCRPLFLLVLLAALGCQPPTTTPDEYYEQATTAFRDKQDRHALDLIKRGQRAASSSNAVAWNWRFRLLEAEIRARDRDETSLRQTLALLEPAPSMDAIPRELEPRRWMLRGKILKDLRQWDLARESLDRAHALASEHGANALLGEIEIRRAEWHFERGSTREAEARVAEAIALLPTDADLYLRKKARLMQGYYRLRLHRYDEAIISLEATIELTPENDPFRARLLTNLGLCYGRLGYFEKALRYLNQAAPKHQEQEDYEGLSATLGETGNNYFFQGDYSTAITYYHKAKNLALEKGELAQASIWTGNLASTLIESKRWEEAAFWNQESLSLKRQRKDNRSILYAKLNDAAIAAGMGQAEVAADHFEAVLSAASDNPALKWEAHAGLGSLYAEQGRWDEANHHFERAITEIEATSERLLRNEDEIFLFARLIRFYQNYVEALVSQDDSEKALEIAERSRARTLQEQIGGGEAVDWRRFREKSLATAQRTNSVFLFYWLAPKRSFLWTISPRGIFPSELPGEVAIGRKLSQYREMIESLRDPLVRPHSVGGDLYRTLVAPALRHIEPGFRVIVVPDGALHGLNFETLPVYEPEPHYWIEDVTLMVTPSLNLASSGEEAMLRPRDSLLLIGDPRSQDPNYPDLEFAKTEMRQIQSHFSDLPADRKTILSGAAATPAAYFAAQPGSFSMIGFIAHAEANHQSPLDSAVILSPSSTPRDLKLYARNILEKRLNAEVVTISACRGAGAKALSGEGLVGFTWAFLQAGARHVVAGLWDVDDRSTSRLMNRFYLGLAQGEPLSQALRNAKLVLLREKGNYRKPYYWGPFQLYIRAPQPGGSDDHGP